jgi:hypothetical protein
MQLSLFLRADPSPWIDIVCCGFPDAWDLPKWMNLGEQQRGAWNLLLEEHSSVLLEVFSSLLAAIKPLSIEHKLSYLPKQLLPQALAAHMHVTKNPGGFHTHTLALRMDHHTPLQRAADVLPELPGLKTVELHGVLTRRRDERSWFLWADDEAYDRKVAAHRSALMSVFSACARKDIRCLIFVRS